MEAHRDELDATIARHAKGWTLDRIAPLDRNVMRVALYENRAQRRTDRGGDRRGGRDHQGVTAASTRPASSTACSAQPCAAGGGSLSRLREIAGRLEAIARELEGGETGDERAGELAQEAAELSAEAIEEANRRMREAEASE